jgi:hypothetical protein
MVAPVLLGGDLTFKGQTADMGYIGNKFIKQIKGNIYDGRFTLPKIDAKGILDRKIYWYTTLTDEYVPHNCVAHFAVQLTEQCCTNVIIGAMEETKKIKDSAYIGRNGNEDGKAFYTSNKSLYTGSFADRGEFDNLNFNPGDVLGIVFDTRERENGVMLLTLNGSIVGTMFTGLKTPLYPGISVSAIKSEEDEMPFVVQMDLPKNWDDKEIRKRVGSKSEEEEMEDEDS